MATKTPIQFESFSDPDCTESSGEKWESDESQVKMTGNASMIFSGSFLFK